MNIKGLGGEVSVSPQQPPVVVTNPLADIAAAREPGRQRVSAGADPTRVIAACCRP